MRAKTALRAAAPLAVWTVRAASVQADIHGALIAYGLLGVGDASGDTLIVVDDAVARVGDSVPRFRLR